MKNNINVGKSKSNKSKSKSRKSKSKSKSITIKSINKIKKVKKNVLAKGLSRESAAKTIQKFTKNSLLVKKFMNYINNVTPLSSQLEESSNIDFSKIKLKNKNITRFKFYNLNLNNSIIHTCKFAQSHFENIDFRNSYFNTVSFNKSILHSVKFNNSKFIKIMMTNSSGYENVNFDETEWDSKSVIKSVDFTKSSFCGTKNKRIRFLKTNISNINFNECKLEYIYWEFKILRDTNNDLIFNDINFKKSSLNNIEVVNGNIFPKLVNCNEELNEMKFIYTENEKIRNFSLKDKFFKNSIFKNISFVSVSFRKIQFEECEFLNLEFTDSQLFDCNFTKCIFTNFKMNNIKGQQISFIECSFTTISFNDNDFQYCKFDNSNFNQEGENINNIYKNNFHATIFTNCKLNNLVAHSSLYRDCNFINSFAENIDFRSCNFSNIKFTNTNLKKSDFTNSRILNVYFNQDNKLFEKNHKSTLSESKMIQCQFMNLNISNDVDLRQVDFQSSQGLQNLNFDGINMESARLTGVILNGSTFRGTNLRGVQFDFSQIYGCDFTGANFEGSNVREAEGRWETIGIPDDLQDLGAVDTHKTFYKINVNKLFNYIKNDCLKLSDSDFNDMSYKEQDDFLGDLYLFFLKLIKNTDKNDSEKKEFEDNFNLCFQDRLMSYDFDKNIAGTKPAISFRKLIHIIMLYVGRQPIDFKSLYIELLIIDSVNAHGKGGLSCAAGIIERIVTIIAQVTIPFKDTVSEEKSSEYQELTNIILNNPNSLMITYNKEWFDYHKTSGKNAFPEDVTPETILNDYIEFMKNKFNYENLSNDEKKTIVNVIMKHDLVGVEEIKKMIEGEYLFFAEGITFKKQDKINKKVKKNKEFNLYKFLYKRLYFYKNKSKKTNLEKKNLKKRYTKKNKSNKQAGLVKKSKIQNRKIQNRKIQNISKRLIKIKMKNKKMKSKKMKSKKMKSKKMKSKKMKSKKMKSKKMKSKKMKSKK